MKSFTVRAKVWIYPGLGGWHFVYVDKKLSEKINKNSKKYGAGFVKVKVKLGKTTWQTALFPSKKESVYLLSIKLSVRKKEKIIDGDLIKIKCELI